jgi:hypothetical protein
VENFMKPTPDALAAGIFCDENQDPRAVARFAFDEPTPWQAVQRAAWGGDERADDALMTAGESWALGRFHP